MAFKKMESNSVDCNTPQELFRDIRSRKIPDLWGHQDKMIEKYMENIQNKDIAMEMPTGSGKTLVALLIGEYRRVRNNEKVLYLCPTKQLVNQVVEQAKMKYGIEVTGFTGSQRNYTPEQQAKYRSNRTISVATYSALFNTNPFFTNPDIIIFDDAHSCENYIGNNWSLNISRYDFWSLYIQIINLVKDFLPEGQEQRFTCQNPLPFDVNFIEMVPQVLLLEKLQALYTIINTLVPNTELEYPWRFISQHLEACQIYISYKNILIRPIITPTIKHLPFSNAKQRIYMSATLGKGGELERITGISNITRLPIIEGWDRQGLGRRFFIFPEATLTGEALDNFIIRLCEKANRTLFLTQDDNDLEIIKQVFEDKSNLSILGKEDIETSKSNFTTVDNSVLVLANRLDGIDMSQDECRLMILKGAPEGFNLQERYFTTALASSIVFRDRVRTRLIQALGRCTRDAVDYSVVCLLGDKITDELTNNNTLMYYHPELQAELKFGYEQSIDISIEDFEENVDIFLRHDEEWEEIDKEILNLRKQIQQQESPEWEKMSQVVKYEIEYQYAIWDKNYSYALDNVENILTRLNGTDVKGYRGFWLYTSIWIMYKLYKEGNRTYEQLIRRRIKETSACWSAVQWIHSLENRLFHETNIVKERYVDYQILGLEEMLKKNQIKNNTKFEKLFTGLIQGLEGRGVGFEGVHTTIGQISGFDADNSREQGAPDPWWILQDKLCLVFEDKIYDSENKSIPIEHVREAVTHRTWMKNKFPELIERCTTITVFLTNALTIDKAAAQLCDDKVVYWNISDFKQYTYKLLEIIRQIRTTYSGEGNYDWREDVINRLQVEKISIDDVLEQLNNNFLNKLPHN